MADLNYPFAFNSSIPSLQIVFETLQTVAPGATATVPHGLGFTPMFIPWLVISSVSLGRTATVSGSFLSIQSSFAVSVNGTNVIIKNNHPSTTGNISVKCYNIDLQAETDYGLAKTQSLTVTTTTVPQSIDLRSCTLHSRCQSPSVLSVKTEASATSTSPAPGVTTYTLLYQNATDYIPWTYAYFSPDGTNYLATAPGTQQSGTIFTITPDLSTYGGTGKGAALRWTKNVPMSVNVNAKATIVALQDPLYISTKVTATF